MHNIVIRSGEMGMNEFKAHTLWRTGRSTLGRTEWGGDSCKSSKSPGLPYPALDIGLLLVHRWDRGQGGGCFPHLFGNPNR